jgi:Glycosyl-4,4'-diaponeurosporenoate acyltransferase
MSRHDPDFANETSGVNLFPFASMAGGWIGPLLMFWLYVWGPLRPFDYPAGDLTPSLLTFVASFILCLTAWWLPPSYYRIRSFEQSGRLYEALGVRLFRYFVPDGDLSNRWRRRREPNFRIITNRRVAAAFVTRTELSEKSHLVLLLMGILSSAFAWQIGWRGWAVYLGVGNVLVNLYPVLLQRYTRARLRIVVERRSRRHQ